MSVKCVICKKIDTNEPDGVCAICKLDGNDNKKHNGGEDMAKREKQRCEVEGCEKLQWREHRCMVHYKEKHGIVRKIGRKQGNNNSLNPPLLRETKNEIPIREGGQEIGGMTIVEREETIRSIFEEELIPLLRAKGHDYAGDNVFSNLRDFGFMGIVVRIGDKYHRLKNFCLSGQLHVKNESVEDTLKDLVNYGLLALVFNRLERSSGA